MLGEGILKGLAETARNFFGSYVNKDRLTTVQFPEERLPQIEATRDFPFLVYDGEDWQQGMRCVACQICEKECPPKCIYIVKSTDKKPDATGKPQAYPAKFDIDISVCMSCQICVEVCPFEAIKMDTQFELSTTDRFGGDRGGFRPCLSLFPLIGESSINGGGFCRMNLVVVLVRFR